MPSLVQQPIRACTSISLLAAGVLLNLIGAAKNPEESIVPSLCLLVTMVAVGISAGSYLKKMLNINNPARFFYPAALINTPIDISSIAIRHAAPAA